MTKLPSFQFYPGDWMKNPNLRSVSPAARGLWIEMLCLMAESERRGFLQVNGKALTKEKLARITSSSIEETTSLLQELEEAALLKRSGEGIIYSGRMVRATETGKIRAKSGQLGGNPNFKKGKSNPYYTGKDNHNNYGKDNLADKQKDNLTNKHEDKQKITPSSSSSSSSSKTLTTVSVARPPAPGVKDFLEKFSLKHREITGTPVLIDWGKDGMLAKKILGTFTQERAESLMEAFFRSTDDFIISAGRSFGVFYSQINKLSSGAQNVKAKDPFAFLDDLPKQGGSRA